MSDRDNSDWGSQIWGVSLVEDFVIVFGCPSKYLKRSFPFRAEFSRESRGTMEISIHYQISWSKDYFRVRLVPKCFALFLVVYGIGSGLLETLQVSLGICFKGDFWG